MQLRITHKGKRHIGPLGTLARVALGGSMFGSVVYGHLARGFHPVPWLLGVIVCPGVILTWHWLRLRRAPNGFQDISVPWVIVNFGLFWVLYFIPFTSDMALIFYGLSMLLAGIRGYSGCEILAMSNALLRRDDQIGCAVFTPIDIVERRLLRTHGRAADGGRGPVHG